jgi:Uma2 family endonuclease
MATAELVDNRFPLITCEQFFKLPEPGGNVTHELHFGELVKVRYSNKGQYDLQTLIRDILVRTLHQNRWIIGIEMPYGLTPGFDVRAADVGVTARKKWDAVSDDDYLIGSPDLVIQIKSRSNRDDKMEQDAVVHITHGASAVWLVKSERREIIVVTASSRTVYGPDEKIKLPAPLSATIALHEIFPS